MDTVRVGDFGPTASRVGLGCNTFGPMIGKGLDAAAARLVVDAALDAGITLFDTAERYATGRSEEMLGAALRGRRDRAVLATKFGSRLDSDGTPWGTATYVQAAIDGSLRRLRTDYVDLYYYHRPDGVTPIAETLGALDDVVRSGKARFIACSNFSAEMIREADEVATADGTVRFIAVQNEYNLLQRQAEQDVLPLCRRLGIGFVPFSPLANGLLTGKYRAGHPAPTGTRLSIPERAAPLEHADFRLIDALTTFARERSRSLLELAVAAVASTPGVTGVIAGATSATQVRTNAAAADWVIAETELAALPRTGSHERPRVA